MNKILLLSAAVCFQSLFSQVTMEKNKLVKDGQTYKMSQYSEVFKNDAALAAFKKSRTNSTVSQIFAFAGGGLVGASIPMLLRKKETQTVYYPGGGYTLQTAGPHGVGYLISGVVLIGAAIPFAVAGDRKAKKAIALENGEGTAFQPYFKLESAGNGLAFSYNF